MSNLPRPHPDSIGKGWLFDMSDSTIICDRFCATFGAIFCFAMFTFLICKSKQSNAILRWTAIAAVFTFALNQLSAVFFVFPWLYHVEPCWVLSIVNFFFYYLSKFFLWTYSILRLHYLFRKPGSFRYHINFLKILTVLFAFEVICVNVLHVLFNHAALYQGGCVAFTSDFIPAVMAFVDISTNVLCLLLFYYQMRESWKMISSTSTADSVDEEYVNNMTYRIEQTYTSRKYTILTGFSVMSTILLGASVAIVPILYTMISFDTIINVICLVLFDKQFDDIYQVICCCCAKRNVFDDLIKKVKYAKVPQSANDGNENEHEEYIK